MIYINILSCMLSIPFRKKVKRRARDQCKRILLYAIELQYYSIIKCMLGCLKKKYISDLECLVSYFCPYMQDKLCHINMLTCDLFMSMCRSIIMLTSNIIPQHVDMLMSHVDINKSHVNIIMLHFDIIYLACSGQKYGTIRVYIRHFFILKSNST